MKIRPVGIALASAALVAVAAPAIAAPPYAVTVGGAASGSFGISADSTGSVTIQAGSLALVCSAVTFNGTIAAGTSVSNPLASATGSTWSGCTVSGSSVTLTPSHTPPWTANATGTATSADTDNIAGYIGGFGLGVSMMGGSCTFSVTGSVDDVFHEATQTLDVDSAVGQLTVSGVSLGCLGQVTNGQSASIAAPFDVRSAGPVYLDEAS